MDSIPREILFRIVTYASKDNSYSDYPDYYVDTYPQLREAMQIYCSCKSFYWFSQLYFSISVENEYNSGYITTDLFGKLIGPSYWIIPHQTSDKYATEFIYYNGEGKIEGTHCYVKMVASNLGLNIVNGVAYEYRDDTMYECAEQIYSQMGKIDPMSEYLIDEYMSGRDRKFIIRMTIPVNNYVITPPEMVRDEKRQFYIDK